jgi:hypothetical protein
MTDSRQATSIHEAGHTITAASLGIPILAVVLQPPGHVSGCAGWMTPGREIDDPEQGILIHLAGARAEFAFGLRSYEGHGWDDLKPDGSGSDLDAALRFARQIDPTDAHGLLLRRRWTDTREAAGLFPALREFKTEADLARSRGPSWSIPLYR